MRCTLATLSLITLLAAAFWACKEEDGARDDREPVTVVIDGEPVELEVGIATHSQREANVVIQVSSPGGVTSEDKLESSIRFLQIILHKQPLIPVQDLPRFDIGPSEREVAGAPPGDDGRRCRERRKSEHNPFQGNLLDLNRFFSDSPTIGFDPPEEWDSYIVMLEITRGASSWRSRVLRVWRWTYRHDEDTPSTLKPVDPEDRDFNEAFDLAEREFAGAYDRHAAYALPVPNPNVEGYWE